MIERARAWLGGSTAARIRGEVAKLRQRPRILAAASGVLIALAQPPFGFLPGLLGYALLLFVLEQDFGARPRRGIFFAGWLAGFCYFFVSCFWVAEAFLVDAATYGWMAPFAATLLPSGIGLFWGAFALLYHRFRSDGAHRFLLFTGLFCLFEVLRGTVLSGFPWNPAGSTWKVGGAMSQMAAYVGVYGLSFITVLIFSSVAVVRPAKGMKGFWPVIFGAGLWAACSVAGEVRLKATVVQPSGLVVRVVQPSVGQRAKWTRGTFDKIFSDYVAMTRAPAKPGGGKVIWPEKTPVELIDAPLLQDAHAPSIVIWPEGALPSTANDLFAYDSWTEPVLSNMLRDNQSLIMGVTRQEVQMDGRLLWRNSMLVAHQAEQQMIVDGVYNKYKLVPFGEFTPVAPVLNALGFSALTHFDDSFTPGERTRPVQFASIPRFLPLICYEGIFPSLDMTSYAGDNDPRRPHWIVNISNDAWFGPTTGPRQHLNLASYRAIEEGLPMIRSTPTGISVLVDPLGRAVQGNSLATGERGYMDVIIPNRVNHTPYSTMRFGVLIWLYLFPLIVFTFDTFLRRAKKGGAPFLDR